MKRNNIKKSVCWVFMVFDALIFRWLKICCWRPPPLPSTVRHSMEIISLSVFSPNKSFWVSAALQTSCGRCTWKDREKVFDSRTMTKWIYTNVLLNNVDDYTIKACTNSIAATSARRYSANRHKFLLSRYLKLFVVQSVSSHATHTFLSCRKEFCWDYYENRFLNISCHIGCQ